MISHIIDHVPGRRSEEFWGTLTTKFLLIFSIHILIKSQTVSTSFPFPVPRGEEPKREILLYPCINVWLSAGIYPGPAALPVSGSRSLIQLPLGTGFYAMKDY
jgi:hypothetical protein